MQEDDIQFANMSGDDDGVHLKTLEIAKPYLKDAKILIAGAGQGSLDYKLLQNGVSPENIESVDYNPEQYKVKLVHNQFCDLNGPIPFEDNSFDVVFSTEVIEHLYNPHNLVNEAWRVLKPGGMFFITTPNVHSIMQKLRFLFSDKIGWFIEADYEGSGHIHPIFDFLMERMTRKKFDLVKYTSQTFHLRLIPYIPAIPMPFESKLFAVNNIYAYKKKSSP